MVVSVIQDSIQANAAVDKFGMMLTVNVNAHVASRNQNMDVDYRHGTNICVNADAKIRNQVEDVQRTQHGIQIHAVADASQVVQRMDAKVNSSGAISTAPANVQNIWLIQKVAVQNQNYGAIKIVNANVKSVYQRAVVFHHKDGSITNVPASAFQECQKRVAEAIKFGQKMLALVSVQRRFHSEAVQVVRNGTKLNAVASAKVMPEDMAVLVLKFGMTLSAVVSASHQLHKVDVQETKDGISRNAHVNVHTREHVMEHRNGTTSIVHANVQMRR